MPANLVDLAVLVVQYHWDQEGGGGGGGGYGLSLPLPVSVSLASGSQIQSIVTCSGFLEPGRYAILPLAFSHLQQSSSSTPSTSQPETADLSRPYVVALYSGREVLYQEHALTRPGFMTESIFLLTDNTHVKSTVSNTIGHVLYTCIDYVQILNTIHNVRRL